MRVSSTLRTAYILQIHKNPEQVNKFIHQLISDDQADVYVHIDKRSYEQMRNKILKNEHVKVLDQAVICEWGDISQVDTTILLLREVLASQKDYDFVCLRSGQDLLVKNGFKDVLINNHRNIYMTLRGVDKRNSGLMEINWPKIARKRYTSFHPVRVYRSMVHSLYRKGINLFPNQNEWHKGYSLFNGAQWFSIPLEVAEYMIDFIDSNPWYYQYFENTLCPDEWFFHTIIMNSHYKVDVVNDNFMYVNWGETIETRNSPLDLKEKDIKAIEESSSFFARKFDEGVDQLVIDYFVERYCFGKSHIAKKETATSNSS
ncbi:glycosyl transferase [Siminovitchia terrae]|uniref:Peptide O-xylosyltransferase n=1 Tax=Siminovitchia terrae TaxID=1914933 RepID=A0ABQ4KZC8_SIMTE|nr:glycosyl transferase [Siminovitchia terrae]GIN97388.1 glycosyl transferase [Siminovitchia terrae]